MSNPIEDFRSAMSQASIGWAGRIEVDGKIHRFKPEGDSSESGWYVLFGDGDRIGGSFGCWRRQITQNWSQSNGAKMDPRELASARQKWRQADILRTQEEAERHQRMGQKAVDLISHLRPVGRDHLYLETKRVSSYGKLLETEDGDLLLPLQDAAGKVWSHQTIDALGSKLFMPGGRVQGCFYSLCDRQDGPLIICEGYATGATIHEATGWAVACAMNCGNLLEVSKSLRAQQPNRVIIIAADNDRFTKDQNPGLEKGKAAAVASKSLLAVPQFKTETPTGTDYNDLANSEGIAAVTTSLEAVAGMGIGTRISIKQLLEFIPDEDPQCVIGNRYLCKGGSLVIVGQTHVGKSSFGLQMAITLALGGDFFGIAANPVKPLKILFIQAENDIGDMAEMFQGILLGTGQMTHSKEHNLVLAQNLKKNLILVRDQVHTGAHFASACRKLVQVHQPDMVFFDPLLSFYGDDINDQQAAGDFLRGQLNPISEETGIIWVAMHHTGKPMKDASKATKNWSAADFSYMGLGSSEFSNWPRAIISIVSAGEDEFRVILSKRGWRAQAKDEHGNPANELFLAHSSDHICWKQIPKPPEREETESLCKKFANSLSEEFAPARPTEIVRMAEKFLKRGNRTVWKMWDRGSGPLGILFQRNSDGLYTPS
jgi:phage/plasmid primase-like uncharacterized protein